MSRRHKKQKVVRLILAGAAGRMSQAIALLAANNPACAIGGAFERQGHPSVGRRLGEVIGDLRIQTPIADNIQSVIFQGDVIIDFTHPEATMRHLRSARECGRGMVIGTTGLSHAQLTQMKRAAKSIPIVQAPNMSVGVNLLFRITQLVSRSLGDDYDVEIIEKHHKHKKDAPSGTAHELARLVATARRGSHGQGMVYGRKGTTGARRPGTIGVHAVRGGDVVGEHTVSFITDGECIELTHRASSRNAFAQGALLAAQFVARKPRGLFTMQDVLSTI